MHSCEQVAHGTKTLVSRIEFSQLSWEVPTREPHIWGAILGRVYPRGTGGDMLPYSPATPLESASPPPSRGCHGPWANPPGIRFVLRIGLAPMAPTGMGDTANEDGPWPMAPPQGGDYGREEARRGPHAPP